MFVISDPYNTAIYGVYDDNGTWTQAVDEWPTHIALLDAIPSTPGTYSGVLYSNGDILPSIGNTQAGEVEFNTSESGAFSGTLETTGDTVATASVTGAVISDVQQYSVNYIATHGGIIDGETPQIVYTSQMTSPVTAVPLEGFTFYRWSDGNTSATRSDIAQNATFTAYFVEAITPAKVFYQYRLPYGG